MRGEYRSFVAGVHDVQPYERDGVSTARQLLEAASAYGAPPDEGRPRVFYIRGACADNCSAAQVAVEVISDGLAVGVTVVGDTSTVGGIPRGDLARASHAGDGEELDVESGVSDDAAGWPYDSRMGPSRAM
jgi:hypothetical protein